MPLSRKLAAEFIGTFWLVFGGCGSAVLAAGFPKVGIGFLGVALAFGLGGAHCRRRCRRRVLPGNGRGPVTRRPRETCADGGTLTARRVPWPGGQRRSRLLTAG
jgi:hypothetical protein